MCKVIMDSKFLPYSMQLFFCILICFVTIEESNTSSQPLLLTTLIESGRISEAQELALVNHRLVKSYSGFLTVNKTMNSNLFFWFIPTTLKSSGKLGKDSKNAPLILWLQGGPGTSSLFGLFVENGPFQVDSRLKMGIRKNSWSSTHSMLYIDSPVGTGFSFTHDEKGYAKTEDDVARDLYSALIQLFQLFPQVAENEFFLAGESYAGKYIPMLARKIHAENQLGQQDFINLKGFAIGAGFFDPENMVTGYADYLYFTGLISQRAREHFQRQGLLTKKLIQNGEFTQAYHIQDELFGGDFLPYETYFKNTTGFDNYFNILEPDIPSEPEDFDTFIQSNRIREFIHVGNQTYEGQSKIVAEKLKNEIFKSVRPVVEDLLNLGYQVLLYVGQLDIVIPHVALTSFINHLDWHGKVDYEKSERKILRNDEDEILGYLQQYENFNYVLVRNAGHHVPFDQPKWSLDLITRFTRGSLN